MANVALYARVSTEKQTQTDTIASQIMALETKVKEDGYTLLDEFRFVDNGYSGSHLVRPALEKLRDKIYEGEVTKLYIHSPDRLSRKYAYQMILVEEFERCGVEVIFLNHPINDNPESHLLLQMQGMIAEYERAKIMERHRRGKIHAAKKGSVNVLVGAPYGYRYIDKHTGGGQAAYQINEEEAIIVRKMFAWVGQERLSLGEVWRRINQIKPVTRKGKSYWNRSTIWRILKNPAYKGQAAFGKRRSGERRPCLRPQKRSYEQSKWNYSLYASEKEEWIYIPVPAIIDENLFEVVQEQLEENKKLYRVRRDKAKNLLQGLTVCHRCQRAYYARSKGQKLNGQENYTYYRCSGTDSNRFFDGIKACNNKPVRTDALEIAVWEEVKNLLKNPKRISDEYQRRTLELNKSPWDESIQSLEKQEIRLKGSLSRLIDSYVQGQIEKQEFDPRIKIIRQNLKIIIDQRKKIIDSKKLHTELQLIVTQLEEFNSCIEFKLENIEWNTKRDIIRHLVKRIEIDEEEVNIVFRVPELPESPGNKGLDNLENWQHCCRSIY